DPRHDVEEVRIQLFGDNPVTQNLVPTMTENNFLKAGYDVFSPDVDDRQLNERVKFFHRDSIPVMTKILDNSVLFTRWFSGLAGPTFPNRAFVQAGSSANRTDNLDELFRVHSLMKQDDLKWRVYFHDVPSCVLL